MTDLNMISDMSSTVTDKREEITICHGPGRSPNTLKYCLTLSPLPVIPLMADSRSLAISRNDIGGLNISFKNVLILSNTQSPPTLMDDSILIALIAADNHMTNSKI